jgi:hypothetical protein
MHDIRHEYDVDEYLLTKAQELWRRYSSPTQRPMASQEELHSHLPATWQMLAHNTLSIDSLIFLAFSMPLTTAV